MRGLAAAFHACAGVVLATALLVSPAAASLPATRAPRPAPTAARAAAVTTGTWSAAQELSTPAVFDTIAAVSCASAGSCAAAGSYTDDARATQVFVADEVAGSWGPAEEVPGTATLNAGGNALVSSISCPAPGDCTTGGYYSDVNGEAQAFVAVETSGSWAKAEELPGSAVLDAGGFAAVDSISCAAVGECDASGYYTDGFGDVQAFVAEEHGGTWGDAEEVPGTASLNGGGDATATSISCPSAGGCSLGGTYATSAGAAQAFVADETGSTWGDATPVPGLAALNGGGSASVTSLSCAASGDCDAAGDFTDSAGDTQAFVAEEASGTWGNAEQIPGTEGIDGHSADVDAISCRTAGDCSAGGIFGATFSVGPVTGQAFVADETGGSWGEAEEVPGTAALDAGDGASVDALSCGASGDCDAAGHYADAGGDIHAFVAEEQGGTWGDAEEIPGTAGLDAGGDATSTSISCPSAGNCGVGGSYTDRSGDTLPFVAGETAGTWGAAEELPGIAVPVSSAVRTMSCPSAGQCTAAGASTDSAGRSQAFVATEIDGTWDGVEEGIPGAASLNAGGAAFVESVSCASVGNCGAGGYYTDGSGHRQAFVADESGGFWGTAREVPVTGSLDAGGNAEVDSVSCASAGNCGAGGFYTDGSGHRQAFVVGERGGNWGAADEVPSSALLNAGGAAAVASVSCAAPGDCAAGGSYSDAGGHTQAFVATEQGGTWANAQEVLGTASLDAGGDAGVTQVSCPAGGDCAAAGSYADSSGHLQAFVVDEVSGRWHMAIEVPGSATLDAGGHASAASVSCAESGDCAAGGSYTDAGGREQAFVADEANGTWGVAEEVPGSARLDAGGAASVAELDCRAPGDCAAGGRFEDRAGRVQAFVATEVDGLWAAAEEVPGSGALDAGGVAAVASVSCGTAGDCAAGGSYSDAAGEAQALVTDLTTPPAVSAVAPAAGSTIGGGAVTVEGSFLDGAIAVHFGRSAGRDLVVRSPGLLTVVPPPGTGTVNVRVTTPDGTSAVSPADRFTYLPPGYYLAGRGGAVLAAGLATPLPGFTTPASDPVVGIAATPDGGGYFAVTAGGVVHVSGDARFDGDLRQLPGVHDVVAIAPTTDGDGYWLVGADGGMFAFGDARYHGSLPGIGVHVNDVVGMVASPSGAGYLVVGADGGVFAFGATRFFGSLPGLRVAVHDIRAVLPAPAGTGYLLVGADGGAFSFGRGAPYRGSLPGLGIRVGDVVGLALTVDAGGYWMAESDGVVDAFGDAPRFPAPAGLAAALPVVAIAAT